MCLAIPGKVVEINEINGKNKFVIDYNGIKREAIMSAVDDLKIGDFVVVNHKVIVMKLKDDEAKKAIELLSRVCN